MNVGSNKYLVFRFTAYDAHAHFNTYGFEVNRGMNQPITIPDVVPTVHSVSPPIPGFSLVKPAAHFINATDNYPNAYAVFGLKTTPGAH